MARLRDAVEALDKAVDDLTSLHVQTFSGELKLSVQDQEGFTQIRKTIDAAKANGEIDVVAESLIQFDGDSYNFIATDAPTAILEAHRAAVEAGLKARQSLLELFSQALGV